MYLVVIAWLYVVTMMAVAEATNTTGTVLGAVITFVLYGLLPMAIVVYLMGTPARRRAIKKREAKEAEEAAVQRAASTASDAPDAGGHAPAAAEHARVAPVREEP
jgi:Na+-transporting methylmalonyl-CoA/oxaloacetate decarboxylase gamma subunit